MPRRVCLLLVCAAFLLGCEKHPSVLVLGIDGADWGVMDPLIEAGYLPTLAELVTSGVRAELDCVPAWPEFACFCPPVWTSIATGRSVIAHQITGLYAASTQRKVDALWNLLARHAGHSTLVAYRNTWPPETDASLVLTEPGLDAAARVAVDTWGHELHPGEQEPETLARPRDLLSSLGLFEPVTGPDGKRLPALGVFGRDRMAMKGLQRLAPLHRALHSLGRPHLAMMILHSPDKSEHASWHRIQPTSADPIDEAKILALAESWTGPIYAPAFNAGTPVSQYLEVDAFLGDYLREVEYDYVMLVSDHGMARNRVAGLPGAHGPGYPEAHRGIFSLTGPGVVPGRELEDVTVFDIFPTVAYIFGIEVPADLPGYALLDGFSEEHLLEHPIETDD